LVVGFVKIMAIEIAAIEAKSACADFKEMKEKILTMRELIRVGKNVLIKQYFATRINLLKEPDRILFRNKPLKILLLLSHMRSGSSLLTHILNSNSEIIGYGETHLEYSSELDLKKLMLKVYFHGQEFTTIQDVEKLKMSEKYVLDKVLHNNKFLTADFLASDKIVTIFLLREPKRSLKSILELKPQWSESQVLNYYVERNRRSPRKYSSWAHY